MKRPRSHLFIGYYEKGVACGSSLPQQLRNVQPLDVISRLPIEGVVLTLVSGSTQPLGHGRESFGVNAGSRTF